MSGAVVRAPSLEQLAKSPLADARDDGPLALLGDCLNGANGRQTDDGASVDTALRVAEDLEAVQADLRRFSERVRMRSGSTSWLNKGSRPEKPVSVAGQISGAQQLRAAEPLFLSPPSTATKSHRFVPQPRHESPASGDGGDITPQDEDELEQAIAAAELRAQELATAESVALRIQQAEDARKEAQAAAAQAQARAKDLEQQLAASSQTMRPRYHHPQTTTKESNITPAESRRAALDHELDRANTAAERAQLAESRHMPNFDRRNLEWDIPAQSSASQDQPHWPIPSATSAAALHNDHKMELFDHARSDRHHQASSPPNRDADSTNRGWGSPPRARTDSFPPHHRSATVDLWQAPVSARNSIRAEADLTFSDHVSRYTSLSTASKPVTSSTTAPSKPPHSSDWFGASALTLPTAPVADEEQQQQEPTAMLSAPQAQPQDRKALSWAIQGIRDSRPGSQQEQLAVAVLSEWVRSNGHEQLGKPTHAGLKLPLSTTQRQPVTLASPDVEDVGLRKPAASLDGPGRRASPPRTAAVSAVSHATGGHHRHAPHRAPHTLHGAMALLTIDPHTLSAGPNSSPHRAEHHHRPHQQAVTTRMQQASASTDPSSALSQVDHLNSGMTHSQLGTSSLTSASYPASTKPSSRLQHSFLGSVIAETPQRMIHPRSRQRGLARGVQSRPSLPTPGERGRDRTPDKTGGQGQSYRADDASLLGAQAGHETSQYNTTGSRHDTNGSRHDTTGHALHGGTAHDRISKAVRGGVDAADAADALIRAGYTLTDEDVGEFGLIMEHNEAGVLERVVTAASAPDRRVGAAGVDSVMATRANGLRGGVQASTLVRPAQVSGSQDFDGIAKRSVLPSVVPSPLRAPPTKQPPYQHDQQSTSKIDRGTSLRVGSRLASSVTVQDSLSEEERESDWMSSSPTTSPIPQAGTGTGTGHHNKTTEEVRSGRPMLPLSDVLASYEEEEEEEEEDGVGHVQSAAATVAQALTALDDTPSASINTSRVRRLSVDSRRESPSNNSLAGDVTARPRLVTVSPPRSVASQARPVADSHVEAFTGMDLLGGMDIGSDWGHQRAETPEESLVGSQARARALARGDLEPYA